VWRPRNALCEEATGSNCMIGSYTSIACSKLDAFGKRRGNGKSFVVLSSPTDRRRVATDVTDQGTQLSAGNAWRQAYSIRYRAVVNIFKHAREHFIAKVLWSTLDWETKQTPTAGDHNPATYPVWQHAESCWQLYIRTRFWQGLRYSRLYTRVHQLSGYGVARCEKAESFEVFVGRTLRM
jgi:hypothetical protein